MPRRILQFCTRPVRLRPLLVCLGAAAAFSIPISALADSTIGAASVRVADEEPSDKLGRWRIVDSNPENLLSPQAYHGLPGLEDPTLEEAWKRGLAFEADGQFYEAAEVYEQICTALDESSYPYWRLARNYWRHGENLDIEDTHGRILFFQKADAAASRGIEIDERCAECMLWKYASLGRLATTRGLLSAVRDAPTMAELLDRGIALKPEHRDGENNSTLANLYYASATFYRMVPDWFWLKWIVGVRGDKERALRDARSAVALSEKRVDYQVELGAALLCLGDRKKIPRHVEEGKNVLRRAISLPHFLPTDDIDQKYAEILIRQPEKACGFSRDGFIDVEAVGRQL